MDVFEYHGLKGTFPTLESIKECLSTEGYCVIYGFDRSRLLEFANEFGTPTVDPRHPYPVRALSPQHVNEANPNTLSSRYGLLPFPFHTDVAHWHTPARTLFLYCVRPGSGHRPTTLIDPLQWKLSNDELHLLCESIWRSGCVRTFLCTVMEPENNSFSIRYDPGCMIPHSLSASDASMLIQRLITQSSLIQIEWSEQTLLVIDNTRILHARGAALQPDTDRVIERILIGGSYGNVGL